jgi:CheY-like chemotaxis protein
MAATIAILVDDLFFRAKIQETAKVVGVTVIALDAGRASAAVVEAKPKSIVLDLNARSFSAADLIRELKSNPETASLPTVAFVSHVQEDLIAAARTAGCDTVMARSAFAQKLPDLLRSLAQE